MQKNNVQTIAGKFIIHRRQDFWDNVIINNGKLILKEYSGVYGSVQILNGSVELDNYAFVLSLYMPNGGNIFFRGKKPCIRMLQGDSLIVHIPKHCERWTDFVQINHATNVKIIRDII